MDYTSQEFFYWLGFIYADGNLSIDKRGKKRIAVSSSIKDRLHLLKLANFWNVNLLEHKCFLQKTQKYYLGVSVRMNKKSVCDYFVNHYELIPNKCHKDINIPKNISAEMINHFIRGYFDGDGCVSVRHRTNPNHYSDYLRTQICNGNQTILEDMAKVLRPILNAKIIPRKHKCSNCFYIEVAGNIACAKFYHYLYDNATIFLERKYNIFQNFLSERQA